MEHENEFILARYSLEKADKALKDAVSNLDISLFVSQNRAYYTVFYTVLALGYLDGFTTSKHHQLMGWFNKKYVHENKIFDQSMSKIYRNLMKNRELSDYDVAEIPKEENSIKGIEAAKLFIKTVKPYILKRFEQEFKN